MGNDKKGFVLPVWLTPALIKLVIEMMIAIGMAIPAMWPTIKEFLESLKGNLPELEDQEAHDRLDAALNSIPEWED